MNQKIKISQLPAKGSNLAAADLLEIAEFTGTGYISKSITGAEIAAGATAGFVPETRTLTINGTTQDLSANRTFTVSTGITIGTTAITSGTVGRVLFEGTGNVVQESANLFWDNTNNRLGIGTSSPAANKSLDIRFDIGSFTGGAGVGIRNINSQGYSELVFDNDTTPTTSGAFVFGYAGTGTPIANTAYFFQRRNAPILFGTNDANRMTIYGTGNIGINTTTDAGFRLDVNGTARVQGNVTTSGNIDALGSSNSINVGNGGFPTFRINSRVTIQEEGTTQMSLGRGYSVIRFSPSNTEVARFNGGNLLINTTTDAGFRLDVNGTARVSNNGAVNVATFTGSDGSTIIDRYGNFYSQGLNATSGINGTGVVGLRINKTDGNGKDWRFEQNRNLTDGSLELGVSPWTNNIMTLRSTGVIGINTNAPNASAQLEVASTTRGFLCPRMTTTQKNAIASPATGLQVYDTTLNRPCFYDGTTWITL